MLRHHCLFTRNRYFFHLFFHLSCVCPLRSTVCKFLFYCWTALLLNCNDASGRQRLQLFAHKLLQHFIWFRSRAMARVKNRSGFFQRFADLTNLLRRFALFRRRLCKWNPPITAFIGFPESSRALCRMLTIPQCAQPASRICRPLSVRIRFCSCRKSSWMISPFRSMKST